MQIKVCGITRVEQAEELVSLSPDFMGLIFYQRSPRAVSEEAARAVSEVIRGKIGVVGVFVAEEPERVVRLAEQCRLTAVQLHGSESLDYTARLRSLLPESVQIWKALGIASPADLNGWESFEGVVDRFLFDTKSEGAVGEAASSEETSPAAVKTGGTGVKFPWSALDAYTGRTPFMLAGGIGPGDASELRAFMLRHPACVGCDINSRFEIAPGEKDLSQVAAFINEVRDVQSSQ